MNREMREKGLLHVDKIIETKSRNTAETLSNTTSRQN